MSPLPPRPQPPPPPPPPPKPEDVVAALGAAQQQVEAVVTASVQELQEVGQAAQAGLEHVSSAVTEAVNTIASSVGSGVTELRNRHTEAVGWFQDLLDQIAASVPDESDLKSLVARVSVDGRAVDPLDASAVYKRILELMEGGRDRFVVRVEGAALVGPLVPLTRSPDELRRVLLDRWRLTGTEILTPNPADWVIAVCIICMTICFVVAALPVALGMGAVLFAIAVAIVLALPLGYEMHPQLCSGTGIRVPLGGQAQTLNCVDIPFTKR